MALSRDQIHDLLREVCATCPDELTCECCLAEFARLVERSTTGGDLCETLRAVERHIGLCPECREEYEALRDALHALRGPDGPCSA